MDLYKNFDKELAIKISVLVFLILIFFQTCSVRNKVIETSNTINNRLDSLELKIKDLEITNINNTKTLVESIEDLTYLSNLTNKQKVVDKQTTTIKKLNSKIQTLQKNR